MPKAHTPLDVTAVRKDFPILEQVIGDKPLVYLDNAATGQKPEAVIQAIDNYYRTSNANVHRGIHELGRRATEAYEGARERMARFINADSAEVIWTRGTSESINLVAASWGLANLREGDEIVLTTMEHHSNLVPWQLIAERTGAVLRYVGMDDQERLRMEELEEVLNEKTRIASIVHISNALGTINPVEEIARMVHQVGALLMVDGAQAAPHIKVDVRALGADFYALSGHKMFGPTGIGVLWGRRELLDAMPPYQGGGEMIRVVKKEGSTFADVPHKFEAGTPNIAGTVGIAAATDYLDDLGFAALATHEHEVVKYAVERLGEIPGVRIFGPRDHMERAGVVSFLVDGAHAHDISTILDSEGIAIRAGHHCAQLVMDHCGTSATARASFAFYNTLEEVDRLVAAIQSVKRIFA